MPIQASDRRTWNPHAQQSDAAREIGMRLHDDLKRLLQEEWGRRLALWLRDDLCRFDQLVADNSALVMSKADGRRAVWSLFNREVKAAGMSEAVRIAQRERELDELFDEQETSDVG